LACRIDEVVQTSNKMSKKDIMKYMGKLDKTWDYKQEVE
jgi:hypothetical protein